jgi:hypothetical protein
MRAILTRWLPELGVKFSVMGNTDNRSALDLTMMQTTSYDPTFRWP